MNRLPTLSPLFPFLKWIKTYNKENFRGDLTAGLTVAVMLIPQGMAYAMLAGLPPIIGIYASIFPIIIYAIFGTSRELAVGPVAMVALIIFAEISKLADPGGNLFIELAVSLTLMVGALQLFMGIFKLGFITNFLSHPVMSGFTSAAALIIGFSQLKHLFGIELPRTHHIHMILWRLFEQINEIVIPNLGLGILAIFIIIISKKINRLIPGALIAITITSIITYIWQLNLSGVSIVGNVPAGLPKLCAPEISKNTILTLLPSALTIAFIGFMESIAVAKKIASEKRYEVYPNKELVALGASNIVGSFFSSMPVTGGFSRTAVNKEAGASTPMASIITAFVIAFSLIFLTPIFYYIPKPALAAVILTAVFTLIDIKEVKHLWKVKKEDLTLLSLTFLGTLAFGIKQGILLGVGFSLAFFFIKSTRPHFAILGKVKDRNDYRNINRYNVETFDHILIIRFDSQFYYGNVSFLKEKLIESQINMKTPLRAIVLESSSINSLDSSADTTLHEILDDYRKKGVNLFISGAKGPVLDVMKRSGFYYKLGKDHYFFNTHEAVEAAKNYINSEKRSKK